MPLHNPTVDFLFLMDAPEQLNPAADTTLALMRKARERGHATWYAHASSLSLEGGVATVLCRRMDVPGTHAHFSWAGEPEWRPVASFPIAWVRKDPPFDMAYIETTWILERVDRAWCRVLNDPAGIRAANEKLYALRFPELCPPTLVTNDVVRLRAFVEHHREAVLKPLGGSGGEGILFAQREMRGLRALIEVATSGGRVRCEAQAYLPGASKGDKRILLLDGEPLGAILRLHGEGEERNNLHLGGHAEAARLSADDRRIVERIAPSLRKDGLVFVGIDVIDGRLTEVNVTSPTGIQELERFEGVDATGEVIDWCERNAPDGA